MNTVQIQKLFNPRSIAIIGASRSKEKVGGVILENLLSHRYRGRIYPVNPHCEKVQGLSSYDSVLFLPEIVDVAIIAIPADAVNSVVEECGQKGIKNLIVLSAGYSEAGEVGLQREFALERLVTKYQINLLGPNCLGLINAKLNINLSFASSPSSFSKGKVSLISQSGAIGTAFLDWAKANRVEVSKFISLGNKIGLNEIDFIKYLHQDKDTEIILLYIENFSDGRKFYELCKLVTKDKPVVVLKPGKNKATMEAMAAHTGSMASNDKIIDVALDNSGCIRVDSIEELFNISKLLDWQPTLQGNEVAIITNAGGVAIEAVDQLESNGLKVKELGRDVRKKLDKAMNKSASSRNPVDLLGDALALDYKVALENVIKDEDIDIILVLLTPQLMTEALATARYLNEIADRSKKVVLACFLGGEKVSVAQGFLSKEKIPHYPFVNDAAVILGKVWQWKLRRKSISTSRFRYPTIINSEIMVAKKGEMLDELKVKKLLNRYDIQYLQSSIASSLKNIEKAALKIKFPLVIKLIHPNLIHKTELKAVRLPIYRKSELLLAARELAEVARMNSLDGYKFELQPFVFNKIELILGIKKDSDSVLKLKGQEMIRTKGFGHVIAIGAGGIYAEVLSDIALRLLPITRLEAREMLQSSKIGKILLGERKQTYDYRGLLTMMVNLGKLIEKNNNIDSIDINPVFVTESNTYAVDVKIFPS